MEHDFGPDNRWLDDLGSPIDGDVLEGSDAGALPPPEEPGRGPGPPGLPANPDLGPWFPLSMFVFLLWGALIVAAVSGLTTGQPLAWALIAGFLTLYVTFLCAGAAWFDRWRRT